MPNAMRSCVSCAKISVPVYQGRCKQKKRYYGEKINLNLQALTRVYLQGLMVPHWVRGAKEFANIISKGKIVKVNICALGGSVATAPNGTKGKVIEVKSFDELSALGKDKVKGKIVFFNRPMDESLLHTFNAYGKAVNQRGMGAIKAAEMGAIASINRSVGTGIDKYPHTGAMHYKDSLTKIPAAAISTQDAELLSAALKQDPNLIFAFKQSCKTLPDVASNNVLGQINSKQNPNKIICVGGHLDSWDLAEGAHDDGTGIVQSMEALRILRAIGYQPKHTLRAVFWMNEENGLRGGQKYAELAKQNHEQHIAALETDGGGFTPRGFSIGANADQIKKVQTWKNLLEPYGLHDLNAGGGGADTSPLEREGVPCFELRPDSQRYFELHHTAKDTFEQVSRRELILGAAALASLIYLIDTHGL